MHHFEDKALLFRGKAKDPGKTVGLRKIQARVSLFHSSIDENRRCIRVVTGVGDSPFKKELVPLFDCYPCNIKRGVFLDIFDEVEEGGRIIWWAARVREMSLLQYMPLIEVLMVLVVSKPWADSLGQKRVYQHSHGSGLDTVKT